MNEEVNELLLYFKTTKEPHSNEANNLIKQFIDNLDDIQKQKINKIVTKKLKKSTKYYKNYNSQDFIRSYIFNKNNGRNIGTLNDYINHYQ